MSDVSLRELFERLMQNPSARSELEERGLDDLDDPMTAEALTHVAATLPPDVAEHFSAHTAAASPVPDRALDGDDVDREGAGDPTETDLVELLASAPEPAEADSDPDAPEQAPTEPAESGPAETDPDAPGPAESEQSDTELAEAFGSGASTPIDGDEGSPAAPPASAAAADESSPAEGSAEVAIDTLDDPLDELGPESGVESDTPDDVDPAEGLDNDLEIEPDLDTDVIDG